MLLVGWAIWAVVAALTLRYWVDVLTSFARRQRFTYALLLQVSLLTSVLVVTAIIPEMNKLHLLWLTPIAFVAGILLSPPF
jgi:hypothetical protein